MHIPAFQLLLFLTLADLTGCNTRVGTSYFIGQVQYAYTYESDSIDAGVLTDGKPLISIFRYDEHNYQSRFVGKDTTTYYYSGELNKCVSAISGQQGFDCEDYGTPTDSIFWYKVYDTTEKILGHGCLILEFQSKYFLTRYYVSKDLKIAPDTYQKHLAYNWAFYGEKGNGGLILKLEHRFKKYTMKGVATALMPHDRNFRALELDEQTIRKSCMSGR